MAESVGNQNRINRSINDRLGEPGTLVATSGGAAIPIGLGYVDITSSAAGNVAILPAGAPVGKSLSGYVAANGFKLKAGGAGTKINNLDASGAAAAVIPANSLFHVRNTPNGWILTATSSAGAAVATITPA